MNTKPQKHCRICRFITTTSKYGWKILKSIASCLLAIWFIVFAIFCIAVAVWLGMEMYHARNPEPKPQVFGTVGSISYSGVFTNVFESNVTFYNYTSDHDASVIMPR